MLELDNFFEFCENITNIFLNTYEENFVNVFFEPIIPFFLNSFGLGDLPIPPEVWNFLETWFDMSLASIAFTITPILVLALAIVSLVLDIIL